MSKAKVITFGEVMLRFSTQAFARFTQATALDVTYAGAEANVAVSVARFGIPSAHVTRFPNNDLGEAATQALRRHGVDTSSILYGDERMGLYFLENGAMQRASRIIYDRFDSAFAHIKPGSVNWDEVFRDASWFHWTGITPAISQGAADVCLEALRAARKKGLTVSGDINYRRNLWQYGKTAKDVMPELISYCDVVIAGITDMENCGSVTGESFEKACANFGKKFGNVRIVATTERASVSSSHNRISALLWNGKLLKSHAYELTHIVDRVGSGDAFMAGLIYAMLNKMNDQDALEFATAACALKHSIEGDVNLVTVEEVESLVKGENVGKLLR
ncbi:MAG TPA: sugar kinase [Chryseosolibacter sp.]|nr:sugar kinase [Chryseosolibacter sp.]